MNLYKALVRPALFRLDPEAAHDLATRALAAAQALGPARSLLGAAFGAPARPVTVAGLSFPNPVGLAAGFDKGCRLASVLASFGFGFVEVGTVTWEAQEGRPKPRLFRIPEREALLNRFGFNNPGAREAARRLSALPSRPVPIGINIGKGVTTPLEEAAGEYRRCLEALYDAGDFFVLNVSSPNTDELRRLHERPRLERLLGEVREAADRRGAKPLFVKISPDLSDRELDDAADASAARGFGLVAANTTNSREGLEARWSAEAGGVSGRPLSSRSDEVLRKLKARVGARVPLIGVGGVFGPEDAKSKLAAGASLVQVYTGWIYEGPGLVKRIVENL